MKRYSLFIGKRCPEFEANDTVIDLSWLDFVDDSDEFLELLKLGNAIIEEDERFISPWIQIVDSKYNNIIFTSGHPHGGTGEKDRR